MSKITRSILTTAIIALFCAGAAIAIRSDDSKPPANAPEGWQTASPRAEISPQFTFLPNGGRDGKGSFVISADEREGLDGHWKKTFPVAGGKNYRFFSLRKAENVASPSRSIVARVVWLDDKGKQVPRDTGVVTEHLKSMTAMAEPEYPTDKSPDAQGWTEVSDTYRAP